jgi:protein gp37
MPYQNTNGSKETAVYQLEQSCDVQRSAFFFKQWGGWGVDGKKRAKKENGRLLQGRTWDAMPVALTPS